MAFTYGFYNAIDHDRTYSATQFGEMFDGLINDGVYSTIGECFMTVPGSGVGVVVKSGRAWFNKTWSVNTADLPLDLGLPDLLLPRIDSVILEVDTRVAVRANAIKVVKGYPAVDPVPPGLTTNDGLYQYPLAYVKVAANATQITKSDITVVVGQTPCPFVTGILQSVPIDDMYQQWEGQFEEWFENLKTTLTEDVVGNLLYQLGQKVDKADKATKQDALTGTDDSKWMTPLRVKEMVDSKTAIGSIVFSVDRPDHNYLPCDGRLLSKNDYPELFNKVGYRYGYTVDKSEIEITSVGSVSYSDYMICYGDPSNKMIRYTSNIEAVVRNNKRLSNTFIANHKFISPIIFYNGDFYTLCYKLSSGSEIQNYYIRRNSSSPSNILVSIPDALYTGTSQGHEPVYKGYAIINNKLYFVVEIYTVNGRRLYGIEYSSGAASVSRMTYNGTSTMSTCGVLLNGIYYDFDNKTCYSLLNKQIYAMPLSDQSGLTKADENDSLVSKDIIGTPENDRVILGRGHYKNQTIVHLGSDGHIQADILNPLYIYKNLDSVSSEKSSEDIILNPISMNGGWVNAREWDTLMPVTIKDGRLLMSRVVDNIFELDASVTFNSTLNYNYHRGYVLCYTIHRNSNFYAKFAVLKEGYFRLPDEYAYGDLTWPGNMWIKVK